MPIFGRKPSGADTGYGEMLNNRIRANVQGSYPRNAWVVNFGGRVGRNTGATPTVSFAAYRRDNRSRIGQSVTGAASTPFSINGQMGSDLTLNRSGNIQIWPGVEMELAMLTTVSSSAYGMGEWGYRHSEMSASAFPATYAPHWDRPEGRMSLWMTLQDNRKPNNPVPLTPAPNSTIATLRPNLTASFSDPDESLGDKVKKFQFEVWTVTNSGTRGGRIHASGVLGASAAVQTSKVVGWNVPTNLTAGRYIARVCTWDLFDEPSNWIEWSFTVNAGGAAENLDIEGYIAPGLVNATTVVIGGTWKHSNNLNTTIMRTWRYRGSGTLDAGPYDRPSTWTANAAFRIWDTLAIPSVPPMVPGNTYYYATQMQDGAGSWSPVARTPTFKVQGPPPTPIPVAPANAAEFDSPPALAVRVSDPDEMGQGLTIEYQWSVDSGSWTAWQSFDRTVYQDGAYWTQMTTADMPDKGLYTWRARAVDAWGNVSAVSSGWTFRYMDPPAVTITMPTAGEVLQTATPQVRLSTSIPTSKMWYVITDASTYIPAFRRAPTTVPQPVTAWSSTVPAGRLVNTRTYVLDVYVETAGGIQGTASTTFKVNYPVPTALTSLSSEVIPGPFEPASDPRQWSRIRLSWDAIPVGSAPDTVFWGYMVERRSLATGLVDLRTVIRSRTQRVFVDMTPLTGVQYEYSLSWIKQVDARNRVISTTVTVQNGVTFTGSVLSDLGDSTLGTVLQGYSDRSVEWGGPKAVEIYDTWGELPIAFQSLNRGDTITGTWAAVDDPQGQYRHTDLIAAAKRMSTPKVSADGVPTPRALYYRDGKGRGMGVVMFDNAAEADRHWINGSELRLTLREVRVTLMEDSI